MGREIVAWHEWVNDFCASLPTDLHPSAQQRIRELIGDMYLCAAAGDGGGIAFAARRIRERVEQEQRFERENDETFASRKV